MEDRVTVPVVRQVTMVPDGWRITHGTVTVGRNSVQYQLSGERTELKVSPEVVRDIMSQMCRTATEGECDTPTVVEGE